jgi:hypothetical protein
MWADSGVTPDSGKDVGEVGREGLGRAGGTGGKDEEVVEEAGEAEREAGMGEVAVPDVLPNVSVRE